MKKLVSFVFAAFVLMAFLHECKGAAERSEAFEKREALVERANTCLRRGDWECAKTAVAELLEGAPHDTNLLAHMAGILFEQGDYEECLAFISRLEFSNETTEYLENAARLRLREEDELGSLDSRHFRVEFEGEPVYADVVEALSVLETAFDSLSELFGYEPGDKLHLVLHESGDFEGADRPDWVGAVFDGKIRVPMAAMRERRIYRPILFHELTHAFIREIAPYGVPFWANEGLAQVIDGSRSSLPKPGGKIPTLEELHGAFVTETDTEKAKKLYWYSERMVREMLAIDSSFGTLRSYLEAANEGRAAKALVEFYGLTELDLLKRAAE